MACRAGAYPAAGMIDLDAVGQRNVENTPRLPGSAIRKLCRINLDDLSVRQKRDRVPFPRRLGVSLFDIRVLAGHETPYQFRNAEYWSVPDFIRRSVLRVPHAYFFSQCG